MADITISNLPLGTPLETDVIPFSNGSTTSKATVSQIRGSSGAITGSVIMWPLNTAPAGYLICNGSAISRTTYSALFAVLGTAYGVGDSSTTFNLPDYRGQFLRGWANGQTTDPDRASRTNRGDGTTGDNVGTRHGYQIQSHTHSGPGGACCFEQGGIVTNYANGNYTPYTTYATGGNETRPTNVYINYCIKT